MPFLEIAGLEPSSHFWKIFPKNHPGPLRDNRVPLLGPADVAGDPLDVFGVHRGVRDGAPVRFSVPIRAQGDHKIPPDDFVLDHLYWLLPDSVLYELGLEEGKQHARSGTLDHRGRRPNPLLHRFSGVLWGERELSQGSHAILRRQGE